MPEIYSQIFHISPESVEGHVLPEGFDRAFQIRLKEFDNKILSCNIYYKSDSLPWHNIDEKDMLEMCGRFNEHLDSKRKKNND